MWRTHLIAMVIAAITAQGPVVDDVDVIEANYYYDECGKLVFSQLVFWEWCEPDSAYHVRAWRLLKTTEHEPYRCRDGWAVLWQDGDTLRKVRACSYVRTCTQYDPELRDREALPKERRRELTQPGRARK